MKYFKRENIAVIVNNYIIDSPTAGNISYIYNIGSILGLILIIQIITGILLGLYYCSDITMAFDSIEHINRDISYGYAIRYTHANGAGLFFIFVYLHIGKALYYGSYNRISLWNIGILIFIIMMITAFIGYVLPFGAMSYWGATVITSMFSAIPTIGNNIVQLIWGGYSVSKATLSRFYGIHYLLPFLLIALVIIHLIYLHSNIGSLSINIDILPFHPYYIFKDILGFNIVLIILIILIGYYPNILGHSSNYIMADPMVTPLSIVPEFYFLSFYAILRAVPNKLIGVILMFSAILILFILPAIDYSPIRGNTFRPLYRNIYWLLISNYILLTWLGAEHATQSYVLLGRYCTVIYFTYFMLVPTSSKYESILITGNY